jgi:hypothetical protein
MKPRRTFFGAGMNNWLACALACQFVCGLAPLAVGANDPPNKIAITTILVAQKNRPPSKADPFPQGSFTQQVSVTFKAAVPKVAHLDDATNWKVTINFDDDSTVVLRGKTNSCATTPPATPCWSVEKTDHRGNVTEKDDLPQAEAPPVPPVLYISDYKTILTLPTGTLTKHVTSLTIDFNGVQSPSWTIKQAACASIFCTAASKSTADNYLSGLYSPAIHSAAQYTIDFKGSYVKQIDLFPVYIGGVATVSTDQRPSADPDSFLVSGVLQVDLKDAPFKQTSPFWSRAQTVLLNWDFAGLEFDRQTTTKTFISSPIVEVPFRIFGNAKSVCSMGMFPYFGIETGTNLRNALRSSGSGFVFRGELGSSVSFKIKTKWSFLSAIGITSSYTARIPATSEIFTNTHYISATGKTISLYSLSTQTRHHLKDELDLTVAKPISITIKHEYGELPPGFRTIHNKVSIGLTVMLFQNNTASSAISAEQ